MVVDIRKPSTQVAEARTSPVQVQAGLHSNQDLISKRKCICQCNVNF